MVEAVKEEIVSQRRSTTLSREAKTSLRNPNLRISFQICSIGFISGVYGGIKNKRTFSGTWSEPALCQAEHRQHNRAGFAASFQRWRALFLVPNAFCCRRRFRQETCRSTSCFCSMSRLQPRLNPQRFLQLRWQTLLSFFRAPQDTQAGSTAQRVFGWG